MTSARDTLTTDGFFITPDAITPDAIRLDENGYYFSASIVVNAGAGLVRQAVSALNLAGVEVTAGYHRDCFVKVRIPTADPAVAQVAAEGIARAIGHVIPALEV